MLKNLKKKIANYCRHKKTLAGKTWYVLCAPFRYIWRGLTRLWAWIRGIDVIGMINCTLLVAIIVLFSMLIIDIIKANKKPVLIVAEPVPVVATTQPKIAQPAEKIEYPTLPIKRDVKTNKYVAEPINIVRAQKCTTIEIKQMPRVRNTMYGDIIIDNRCTGKMLKSGDTIQGNLYLQNMRKYTLPCDIRIEGNLFLRDLGMLQFCGEFTVTGNIYVSPRSSFGPLPRTARIGGQVII